MHTPRIPFAIPEIGADEIEEVVDTLSSGWISTGPKAKRFESEFASFIGSGVYAVAVNSATAGLHLALEAAGIRGGDQVITSPYTFTATAEAITYLGADPVFVDIDPSTMNIDPKLVEEAVTPKTRAIVPVHFGGLPCDMEALITIAKRHNLKIIEDAAHAFPATTKGAMVGSLDTEATVFSFYATKPITTGEGGMIVTKSQAIANRCQMMRLHGISRDVFDRYTSGRTSWKYDVLEAGFKYNMSDIAASIGIHQLKKAKVFQEKRAKIADSYADSLADQPLQLPRKPETSETHAWHLYVVRLLKEARSTRDDFIEKMASRGIRCSVHFIPLHIQPYWRDKYALTPEMYPNTLEAYRHAVSLPIYSGLKEMDLHYICETIPHLL